MVSPVNHMCYTACVTTNTYERKWREMALALHMTGAELESEVGMG